MKYQHSKNWKTFREEVLRLDEYKCCTCGKSKLDGAILHVHHKDYILGHKPWEYPYEMCQTLCSGCHAIEHGIIPPKMGWLYVGFDDLGGLYGTCEYCGKEIRYSHLISHKSWRPIEVGTNCCDNLTATDEANLVQKEAQKLQEKRKRFVSSTRWEYIYDEYGYKIYKIKLDSYLVFITNEESGYTIKINFAKSQKRYASLNEAKIKAFDVIESGEFRNWINKRNQSRNPSHR